MGKLVSPSMDHADGWIWNGEQFIVNSTLDEYPRALGILPTAKSTDLKTAKLTGQPHSDVEGLVFPGQGKAYPTCGDPVVYVCPKCGTWKQGKKNCRRATCPKCYSTWAWIQAKKSTLRILKAREIFARKLGRAHRPIHAMISLPKSEYGLFKNDYSKAKRKARKLLKQAGILGGAMIPHHMRQACSDCGGSVVGKWGIDEETGNPYVIEARCGTCGSTRCEWIFSPHFHIVGYGWVKNTERIEAATGYVIKNIGLINNVGGTIWYQLTHCMIRKGVQIVTYFGLCAYNKYKSPPMPPHLPRCPECQTPMRLYIPGIDGLHVDVGKPPPGMFRPTGVG